MRVSIVIPIYNRVHLLSNALRSVIDQSYKSFEVIVCDDGSANETAIKRILLGFGDKRFHYHRIEHSGQAVARDEGYKIAKGEILVFQDHDDLSMPNRLEKIVKYFDEHPDTDVFYHGHYVNSWDEIHQAITRKYYPALSPDKDKILKAAYLPDYVAFRKGHEPKLRLTTTWVNSYMNWIDWIYADKKFGWLDEGLYEYVLHQDRTSLLAHNNGERMKGMAEVARIVKEEYGREIDISNLEYK